MIFDNTYDDRPRQVLKRLVLYNILNRTRVNRRSHTISVRWACDAVPLWHGNYFRELFY